MPDTRILALESSGAIGGAAVVDGDFSIIHEVRLGEEMRHGKGLLPAAKECMAAAGGLDAISGVAVDIGPGSYTGLRVGVMCAKSFAWARSLPVWGVQSLPALAWQVAGAGGSVAVAVRARRGEAYYAVYKKNETGVTVERDIVVLDTGELQAALEALAPDTIVAGNAIAGFASGENSALKNRLDLRPELGEPLPSAIAALGVLAMRECGQGEDVFALQPIYPRREGVSMPVLGEPVEGAS